MDPRAYQKMLASVCRTPCVLIHYMESLCDFAFSLEELPVKVVAWVYPSNTPRQWRGIGWWGATPDFTKDGQDYKNPTDKRIAERIANGERARLYDWWEIDQVKNIGEEKTEHPCQIPLLVMARIIKITDGDLIIDPFMGSGTTLRAAKDAGRKAIGIEMDERYCEIAARRMGQEVLALEESKP
jgi:DNA modification methylase